MVAPFASVLSRRSLQIVNVRSKGYKLVTDNLL